MNSWHNKVYNTFWIDSSKESLKLDIDYPLTNIFLYF